MEEEIIDIFNNLEDVIGAESRKNVHKKGLLHLEINVWLVTPNKEIVFQIRGPRKRNRGKLDSSVSGHIPAGMTPEEGALKEIWEETGMTINKSELIFLKKLRTYSESPKSGIVNNVIRHIFAVKFTGKVSDLKIEKGMCSGFMLVPIKVVLNPSIEIKKIVLPFIFSKASLKILEELNK